MAVETTSRKPGHIADDIEGLKLAMKESEARYSRLMEYLDNEVMVFAFGPNRHEILYVSSSVENILGYTPAEFISPVAEHWTPNPINDEAKLKANLSLQGMRQPPYKMELYHQDGTGRLLEATDFPVYSNQGDVIRVESIVRDITEANKAEERLSQSRRDYETIALKSQSDAVRFQKQFLDTVEFFVDPTFVVDEEKKIIAWNRAMEKISGITKSDVFGKKHKKFLKNVYKDDKPLLVDLLGVNLNSVNLKGDEVKEENSGLYVDRYLPRINKGAGGYVRISAFPLTDPEGKRLGAIESIRDISEPTIVEAHQRQREKILSAITQNLPGMAYRLIQGKDWIIEFASQSSKTLTGFEHSYFENKDLSTLFDLIHPDDVQKLKESYQKAISAKGTFSMDCRLYTSSGEIRWVYHYGKVCSAESNSICIEGYFLDFTDYKNATIKSTTLPSTATQSSKLPKFGNIIGNSKVMKDVYELIVKAAGTTDSVFISGESGTGKELVSQAIHNASDRASFKCVTVNCGAIPENLIESEFFGYQKGAFTGATTDKKGFLEEADGGTLFLDEIGDISLNMQVKMLRAIEGGGFSPIGSRRVIRPNLRVIAASNKDPINLVKQGHMRSDFYFRIHVIPIELPPLRDRGNDIALLIDHFLGLYRSGSGKRIHLSLEEQNTLKRYNWPGNVRELQNVIRRYIALRNLDFLNQAPIFEDVENQLTGMDDGTSGKTLSEAVDSFEKKYITQTLRTNRWQKGKTAEALAISRKTLFRKMKQFEIE